MPIGAALFSINVFDKVRVFKARIYGRKFLIDKFFFLPNLKIEPSVGRTDRRMLYFVAQMLQHDLHHLTGHSGIHQHTDKMVIDATCKNYIQACQWVDIR